MSGTQRTFTAVVNPISGGGHGFDHWRPVSDLLHAAGATVRAIPTQSREHAITVAGQAAARGEVVVAVGGDGMVRDVADGVVRAEGTMGLVPAGRGNDLAWRLGLPQDPAGLARLLLEGEPRAFDVLDVNGVIAPGNVYIGIDSLATQIINANRRLPALLVYRLAPVRAILRWRPAGYTLDLDGERSEVRAHTVVVANSGAYGHGLRIVPPAEPDDGRLDVMVVGDGPRRKVVSFMGQAKKGTHIERPEVTLATGTAVTVDADRPVPVCADGDEVTTLPARITLLPGALKLLA
ncbi:diacylglycerol kinase family lipid kinase [Streptacidiphilus pinicola]|uniref:Diacylglycerol kinase family lipid kinase n=1 Tax=Streptacidiphilus pinicola TaxID=2219663 RepID=A0A2X0IA09_9ACTN|nr:diacylglycerol kinase family protein [Streptacidiphilus pinicola]RAG81784.1 diacylglycerol kinase family lipid kinase [Streptacidiphilus pinicola]